MGLAWEHDEAPIRVAVTGAPEILGTHYFGVGIRELF